MVEGMTWDDSMKKHGSEEYARYDESLGRGRGIDWLAFARKVREAPTEEEAIDILIKTIDWWNFKDLK
jgi:hypothetical protein